MMQSDPPEPPSLERRVYATFNETSVFFGGTLLSILLSLKNVSDEEIAAELDTRAPSAA
jgi:hypothetical protein